jgi:hypothetical protein
MIFYATIDKGVWSFDNPAQVAQYIKKYKDGARLEITIQKIPEKVTKSQRAMFFGAWMPHMMNYFGYEKHEMELVLMKLFLRVDKNTVRTLGSLNKQEWSEFMTRVQRWMVKEFNIELPDPVKKA